MNTDIVFLMDVMPELVVNDINVFNRSCNIDN